MIQAPSILFLKFSILLIDMLWCSVFFLLLSSKLGLIVTFFSCLQSWSYKYWTKHCSLFSPQSNVCIISFSFEQCMKRKKLIGILSITNRSYSVSQKKTLLKEMCDFLTLKMLPLALALIKTKNCHLFDPLVRKCSFYMRI